MIVFKSYVWGLPRNTDRSIDYSVEILGENCEIN